MATLPPVTQSTSETLAGREEEDIPIIVSKWMPLPVTSIEAIHVINKKYFGEDEKVATLTGSELNVAGKLKECDLKLTFTLPYSVSKHSLSTLFKKCTGLATEDIQLTIGCHMEEHKTPKLIEPAKYCVIIPLLRGYIIRKPLLDYVDTTGHQFVHYTIEIPGVGWPTMNQFTWRIRIKVSQFEDRIECMSVSSSPLDIPRVKEASAHVSGWLKSKWNAWFPTAEHKIYQVGHQLGQAVQSMTMPRRSESGSTVQPEFNQPHPMFMYMQPTMETGQYARPIRSESGGMVNASGSTNSTSAPIVQESTTVTSSTKYISPSY